MQRKHRGRQIYAVLKISVGIPSKRLQLPKQKQNSHIQPNKALTIKQEQTLSEIKYVPLERAATLPHYPR